MPTVTTNATFITTATGAHKGRDITVMNLPGAFLHVAIDEKVIVVMEGFLAEFMAITAPQVYKKYITMNIQGQPILFVRMQMTLYGMLISALLFYRKLLTNLELIGFKIYPYDPCAATKMIKRHQHTITGHMDNLKVSHKDPKEVKRSGKLLDQYTVKK